MRVFAALGLLAPLLLDLVSVGCDSAPASTKSTPLSFNECRMRGGEPRLDPGGGLLRACQPTETLLGRLSCETPELGLCGEGGICCKPPILTRAQCTAQNGQAVADPGDGSTRRNGCPDGRQMLGFLDPNDIGDEGGICCATQS